MKFRALIFTVFLSQPVLAANPYQYISVPHAEVLNHLRVANEESGTPKNLQGLWWMDGNPLADEVISFASAAWTPFKDSQGQPGYEAYIPVYDEGIWSWHDSKMGHKLHKLAWQNRLIYHVVFNQDFTFAQVSPIFNAFGILPDFELEASKSLNFTMRMVNENEYARDSIFLGKPSSYRFRRLADAHGKPLPGVWQDFLDKVEVDNAWLPICSKDNGQVLPTACVD